MDLQPCIFGTVLSFFSGNKQILIDKKYAHAIAHWIIANVPEELPRDREEDMKELAKVVLERMESSPEKGYLETIWGASCFKTPDGEPGFYAHCALDILSIEPEGHDTYSDQQIAYGQSLVGSLPGWIRDRALGIGSD